jgi:hypothetical protein
MVIHLRITFIRSRGASGFSLLGHADSIEQGGFTQVKVTPDICFLGRADSLKTSKGIPSFIA